MKNYLSLLLILFLFSSFSFGEDSTCVRSIILGGEGEGRPDLTNQIVTTHFIIHWESPTQQTYAENTADYAEYAYQKQCTEMGWAVPPPDDYRGGDNKYDVYLVSELSSSGLKGETIELL